MDYMSEDAASYGLSPTATMALGAAVGLALGYLFFTDHGRQLRARVEPELERWLGELSRLRETAEVARRAYTEGRDSFAPMNRVTHTPRSE